MENTLRVLPYGYRPPLPTERRGMTDQSRAF